MGGVAHRLVVACIYAVGAILAVDNRVMAAPDGRHEVIARMKSFDENGREPDPEDAAHDAMV